MSRKKHYHIPRPPRRHVDLDGKLDTSGTQSNEGLVGRDQSTYKKSEDVPPPFRGEDGSGFIRKSEISLTWKVAGVVAAIFISIGVPVIWFASGLSKDVDNLSLEVVEIKNTTSKLLEGSIRSEERLNSAEKSIDSIARTLQANQKEMPNNHVNKDASR